MVNHDNTFVNIWQLFNKLSSSSLNLLNRSTVGQIHAKAWSPCGTSNSVHKEFKSGVNNDSGPISLTDSVGVISI